MKKRLTQKEMIEKRNSDLEINRRLNRMKFLSLYMHGRLSFNHELSGEIHGCMAYLFSYISDDAFYVHSELTERKRRGWGEVKTWNENNKDIAENYK